MLIIVIETHKADFLERRQSTLKTTITTSFLSFKMYKNGGVKRENLIYVNNSKGLREQKQYRWTEERESARGLYTALLSVKQCSVEGSQWQRF